MAGNKYSENKEEKQFWAFVEKTAREVESWPAWMRGGSSAEPVKKTVNGENRLQEPKQAPGAKRRS